MKKILFAAAMLFAPSFVAASFTDTAGTVAAEAVNYLQSNSVVSGFSDGSFRPDNPITRAEFLKIALLAAGKSAENCTPTKDFPDVEKNAWYFGIICMAVNDGVISGYGDGKMRPNDSISFAEAAKIVANVNKIALPEEGGEWFQKYVDAVNRDRLFPGSVSDIQKKLTRGEMAQMAWGAATGNEVVNAARGDLPEVQNCDELAAQFQKAQKRSELYQKTRMSDFGIVRDFEAGMPMDAVAVSAEKSASAVPSAAPSADDFSTTNIQEFGVDEADIVKNDGSHIFLIKGNAIRIVRAFPAEKLAEDGKIILDDANFTPQEMYLDGNVLTVIGTTWGNGVTPITKEKTAVNFVPPSMPYFGGSQTIVVSFDVSDRKNPKEIRRVSFEGNYLSSRKIGATVFVALSRWNRYWDGPVLREDSGIVPLFSDSANASEKFVSGCAGIRYVPNFSENSFLILAAIDTKDASKKVDREVVLGGGQNVYASSENMFITNQRWGEEYFDDGESSGWKSVEKTEIFKFALGENSVAFVKKGEVLGTPLNQFSMSEFGGNFRIATQMGQAWDSSQKSTTNVFVLDKNLEKVGEVRDIAPGENMKSARFEGNRAFLVTFKTVDPLFVLDLSDPRSPKILGKLKIPGWSDYLHPWGEKYLLGFGREVDESIDADKVHSDDAVYYTAVLGMKVSLFDISDLEHPKEVQKLVIGDRGTTSPLLTDHKALLADRTKGLVGFPITITKNMNGKVGTDADIQTIFSGAVVLDVDPQTGITERGRATNYKTDDFFKKSGEYFYGDPDRNIDRILYIGDTFYTVAKNYVEALDWKTLSVKKSLQLDEKICEEKYSESECVADSSCKAVYYNSGDCVRIFGQDVVCTGTPVFSACESVK